MARLSVHLAAVGLSIAAAWFLAAGCDRAGSSGAGKSQILVYTAMEADQVAPIIAAFHKNHPEVQATVVRDSTGVLVARLLSEGADTKCDVVWGTPATALLAAEQRGLLEPYSPPGLEHINPKFRDKETPPRWVGSAVLSTAIAANVPELKRRNLKVPRSFEDLTDPGFKGLVTMPNPASSGTGYLIVCGILAARGEQAGWAQLDRLHANIAQYTHSGSKPATMASAGEYPVGVSLDQRCVEEKGRGTPIEVVFPEEKAGWEVEAMGLIKKQEIKPAAKVFIDWAVSPAAFAHYTKYAGVVTHDGFSAPPPGYPPKLLERLADLDVRWAAENRERILAEWNRRYAGKSEAK